MKKRILLSLVSLFMMTAMWANVAEAYKITVSAAANGKTYENATLTLNMNNRNGISHWSCTVVLPAGVTYVEGSAAIVPDRYPEGYFAVDGEGQTVNPLTVTVNADGSVTFECAGLDADESGQPDVALTGTTGAVAEFEVAIAGGEGGATVGENTVTVETIMMWEPNIAEHDFASTEYVWTIEEGEAPFEVGDINQDGKVDLADATTILNFIADDDNSPVADVNGDGKVDIADYQSILNIIADQ